jgi:type III restriction enzyme
MARKGNPHQSELFEDILLSRTAPCVPALREAVASWRASDYKGITDTTRELLNYWFFTDHLLSTGKPFKYHAAQKEAIETAIYLFEVRNIRSRKALLETFSFDNKNIRLPSYDDFARYCIKMATGSGKTKVMALAVVWQFANAVKEGRDDYAKTFLILAPNVIVFERLQLDFGNGLIFKNDPLIPRHYNVWWDMQYYMRGDPERSSSAGNLYLSNIQQFYDRSDSQSDKEPEIMTAMLGNIPPTQKHEISDFDDRIAKLDGPVMVINDEAHHTHDEKSKWNKFIRGLNDRKTIAAQVDFSATPRYSKGALFPWTISDYPLKQAISDGLVKRPVKGISHIDEGRSSVSNVRYAGFLTAGVCRWKEYEKQLKGLKKKPILFIMMNSTEEADDIGDWLRTKFPSEFGGDKTLVIHTDSKGEVSKGDVEKARKLARNVDQEKSTVNAIVSVLMLREGWDVQNVTVVVGLRPYTSKANILPEQAIGRGLRLMFRGDLSGGYTERVDIIGNKTFLEFIDDLEKIEDFQLDTFEIGKDRLKIITIAPDPEKIKADIAIPELTPILTRKKSLAEEIAALDVQKIKIDPLPLGSKDSAWAKNFMYEGRDILTDEKLFERQYEIPEAQTAEEVIGYYARRISQEIKLPSQFAALAPKLREFFEYKAFGKQVNLGDPAVVKAVGSRLACFVVLKEFEKLLRELVVEEKIPELVNSGRPLSSTPPFPFSRLTLESAKTIFNLVACHNDYERDFASFLHNAEDVAAFAKLPEQFGFCIQYTDTRANLRNYFPDFVARLKDGSYWIIETKGREDIEVALKDDAARTWCEHATHLTGKKWFYIKVLQKDFEELRPERFEELGAIITVA